MLVMPYSLHIALPVQSLSQTPYVSCSEKRHLQYIIARYTVEHDHVVHA